VALMVNSTESYQLFKYDSCPFCMRVRAFLQQEGLDIPLRDTMRDPAARRELIAGGGRGTVPCLRIESGTSVRWLYESLDIIEYLRAQQVA
jgi:glutathione S-transferase